MNKQEYLSELQKRISALPESEQQKTLDYYSELIDDKVEDTGLNEEEVISKMENPRKVASNVMGDVKISTVIKNSTKAIKDKMKGENVWLVVLLCVFAFPFIVAVLSAVFAVFVAIYAVAISIFLASISIAVGGVAIILSAILNPVDLITSCCWGGLCVGLGLWLIYPSYLAMVGVFRLTGKLFRFIKIKVLRRIK